MLIKWVTGGYDWLNACPPLLQLFAAVWNVKALGLSQASLAPAFTSHWLNFKFASLPLINLQWFHSGVCVMSCIIESQSSHMARFTVRSRNGWMYGWLGWLKDWCIDQCSKKNRWTDGENRDRNRERETSYLKRSGILAIRTVCELCDFIICLSINTAKT